MSTAVADAVPVSVDPEGGCLDAAFGWRPLSQGGADRHHEATVGLAVFTADGGVKHVDFTSVCQTAESNLAFHPEANGRAEELKHGYYEEALKTADDVQFYRAALGLGVSRGSGFQTFLAMAVKDQLDGTASDKPSRYFTGTGVSRWLWRMWLRRACSVLRGAEIRLAAALLATMIAHTSNDQSFGQFLAQPADAPSRARVRVEVQPAAGGPSLYSSERTTKNLSSLMYVHW